MSDLINAVKSHQPLDKIIELCVQDSFKTDSEGKTALMHAVISGYNEAASILMCECGKFDKQNKNAYMYAMEKNNQTIANEIEEQYEKEEIQCQIPKQNQTVWQFLKSQQNQQVQKQNQQSQSDNNNNQPEGFQLNRDLIDIKFDDDIPENPPFLNQQFVQPQQPAIILSQKQNVSNNIAKSKALLTDQQYQKLSTAEYFMKALAGGCQNQDIKNRIKSNLDRDISMILCEEFSLTGDQLQAVLK